MLVNLNYINQIRKGIIVSVVLFFLCVSYSFSQTKGIEVSGLIKDEANYEVPYASISFAARPKGTITNEDGVFKLMIESNDVNDSLVVNCMGYEAYKFKIQDYLDQEEKVIILKENITSLDEIKILATPDYVKNAIKNLKKTTVSKSHQLTLLYRRASSEENKARFFVEHYMKVLDRGPSSIEIDAIEVLEVRKSADYRFFKKEENRHSVIPMTVRNPIRQFLPIKKIKWKKVGDTSYDGEDVVIIEGKPGKGASNYMKNPAGFKLYIGVNTFSIYRIENKNNNSLYVYNKYGDGKLYLAYHSRQWKSMEKISAAMQKKLGKAKDKIQATYKHEVFTLNIETNRKKMRVNHQELTSKKDMANLDVPYHANFWSSFVAPPDTKYFIKIKKELESNYGVPLDKQFLYSNK